MHCVSSRLVLVLMEELMLLGSFSEGISWVYNLWGGLKGINRLRTVYGVPIDLKECLFIIKYNR